MADLYHDFGNDLQVSPSGDLLLIDNLPQTGVAPDLSRQRIIRRLLTPVRGYIWHLEYGAGIPQKIGLPEQAGVIQALVAANIALEASVATYPPPITKVTQYDGGLFLISITYTDAQLGEQTTLVFDTTGQISNPTLLLGQN
jgi:hypothetical protein